MPAKARLQQFGFQRFMQSLLLGAAGSVMTTAAAQAQACPAAVGGTITVASGVTCGPLNLTGGTNLVVDHGGKITNRAVSTVAGGPQGNITINGEVSQTASANALTSYGGTSVGNITIGATGRVSANVPAMDYRELSTSLGSFTNYGTLSSAGSGAFYTSVATVGGNIANYGSITGVNLGISTANQTINGDIINGKTTYLRTFSTHGSHGGWECRIEGHRKSRARRRSRRSSGRLGHSKNSVGNSESRAVTSTSRSGAARYVLPVSAGDA